MTNNLIRRIKRQYTAMLERRYGAQVVACSRCFADVGLQLDAQRLGKASRARCSLCQQSNGAKLTRDGLEKLAHRFFVWGSLHRADYGAYPVIQFNEHQPTSVTLSDALGQDASIFTRHLNVGFFYYGPRYWMFGQVEPLKALLDTGSRGDILERILAKYPALQFRPESTLYRVRLAPLRPRDVTEYDSPPPEMAGKGRLDSAGWPVLYASQDLEVCVHECRITAEDEVYVATLRPMRALRLLDLSTLIEENVTEFESLDMAVHMLFLAASHSYEVTRAIARAVQAAGFDGLIYPSYFSLLRLGVMPFETTYGISLRRIPSLRPYEQAKSVPNVAVFGRPVNDGLLEVACVNRLVLSRVTYEFHFGPAMSNTEYVWPFEPDVAEEQESMSTRLGDDEH